MNILSYLIYFAVVGTILLLLFVGGAIGPLSLLIGMAAAGIVGIAFGNLLGAKTVSPPNA